MDVKIKTNDMKVFNYCSRAIIRQGDKFLIMCVNDADYYHLPGGHIEVDETSTDALDREIMEEIGIAVDIEKLFFVSEEFYAKKDVKHHSVIFYYLAKPKCNVLTENEIRMEQEQSKIIKNELRWVTCDELKNIDLRPTFIKELILNKDFETLKHYISR